MVITEAVRLNSKLFMLYFRTDVTEQNQGQTVSKSDKLSTAIGDDPDFIVSAEHESIRQHIKFTSDVQVNLQIMRKLFKERTVRCLTMTVEEEVTLYPLLRRPPFVIQEAVLMVREYSNCCRSDYCEPQDNDMLSRMDAALCLLHRTLSGNVNQYKHSAALQELGDEADCLKLGLLLAAIKMRMDPSIIFDSNNVG